MFEFKPRTHSDPDLPQLLPLPVRPHSSYQAKLQFKDQAQFQEQVVFAMSQKLGIDLLKDAELRWVIRDCLLALKEEGWHVVLKGQSDLAYVHMATEESRSFHKAVELHRQLAERLMFHKTHMTGKMQDRFFRVKLAVFEAVMGQRDVRAITSPELMEDILACVGVDVHDEPYLIRPVKNAVEDAYYRVKHEGANRYNVENIMNAESLIVQLELDRVGFLKKISPSGLLYCVETPCAALADVASAGDHDVYCNVCYVATHSTGHRMDHPAVFIEQFVCSECQVIAAVIYCYDCADLFCYDCFQNTHRYGKRKKHCVRLAAPTYCDEIPELEADYICIETGDILSKRAAIKLLGRGSRLNHSLYGLRKAAYSKKLFANNIERVMNILERKKADRFPLSPWFVFYDEAKSPFWYNFQTRERIRADPYQLQQAPSSDASGVGGGPELLQTRAAQKASESAVFDVPAPLHIKFASPSVVQPSKFQTTAVEDFKNEISFSKRF